jgi:hypothetical protein
MQINQSWNREGQRVIFKDSGSLTECFITLSRTTLGGKIKHYGIDNQGIEVLFYEKDILEILV